MKKSLILILLILFPFSFVQASIQSQYKMPGTHVVPIKDTQFNKQYELYIKLPKEYGNNKDKKYPVVYLTDGAWHIELFSSTTYFLMEDVILVGVSWQKDVEENLKKEHGDYVSRFRDYSIRKSDDPERQAKYQFGQAKNHLAFIRNDVFKYVESNYRTDPHNRTYFGFSLGGLFGSYILMKQPDTFKNYILGSPSLWRDIPLLEELGSKHQKLDSNVYVTYGSLEKELSEHVDEFVSLLKKRNDKSLLLEHVVIDDAGHGDSFPMVGVKSIKWLAELSKDGE